jgi:hypothetical protein
MCVGEFQRTANAGTDLAMPKAMFRPSGGAALQRIVCQKASFVSKTSRRRVGRAILAAFHRPVRHAGFAWHVCMYVCRHRRWRMDFGVLMQRAHAWHPTTGSQAAGPTTGPLGCGAPWWRGRWRNEYVHMYIHGRGDFVKFMYVLLV